ncbi:alpha/beta hydrolase [Micromonospora sp. WMMD1082]|uniref:alpha/beta hydrolase n=1 Tax=Micromonospora sp. WMMD1082 TaxID=3016104 RepID=UPI002416ED7B|nr:alpha/beta hydrolase [Micromonospora sp. WMMD1082]MDG4796770.1 alpha/beta hydrolase [Micromonospora sp. WMMD1082]
MVCRDLLRVGLAALLGAGLVVPPAGTPAAPAGFVEAYPSTAAAMDAAGTPYAGWAAQGRRFLTFDPDGDGRAVEVLGDLATADRIAVLVPGVGNRLADFDRGLGGVSRRAPARQARDLQAAVRAADPYARVAVLAWLGYDPPDGVAAAATPASARRGAADLGGQLRTLAGQRPTARITLIGHSYGALVVGLAAVDAPPQVTDVVALGGVGVGVDRADRFGRVRVWAAEAPDDWIRRVPQLRLPGVGHGVRPGDPSFGARPLPVAATGHDGYLLPAGPTLAAVAAVVLHGATDPAAPVAGTSDPEAAITRAGGTGAGTAGAAQRGGATARAGR